MTTADEKRDKAKDLIKEAKELLNEALDKNTWGATDYNGKYIETLEQAVDDLRKILRKI